MESKSELLRYAYAQSRLNVEHPRENPQFSYTKVTSQLDLINQLLMVESDDCAYIRLLIKLYNVLFTNVQYLKEIEHFTSYFNFIRQKLKKYPYNMLREIKYLMLEFFKEYYGMLKL